MNEAPGFVAVRAVYTWTPQRVEVVPGILAHMNADHADAMILLAKLHSGIEATGATMTPVDRLGSTYLGGSGQTDLPDYSLNPYTYVASSPFVSGDSA